MKFEVASGIEAEAAAEGKVVVEFEMGVGARVAMMVAFVENQAVESLTVD